MRTSMWAEAVDRIGHGSVTGGANPSSPRMFSEVRRRVHPVLQLGVLGAGVDIDHRCLHKRVAELLLDGQQMRPAVEQISGQRVPQEMWVDALLKVRTPCGRADHLAQVLLRVGTAAAQTDEQQIAGLAATLANVLGQQAHARCGDVRVAILLRLRGLDVQRLPAQIDVAYPQETEFAIAQTGIGERRKSSRARGGFAPPRSAA